MMRPYLLALAALTTAALAPASREPAHHVRQIIVRRGVELEVLDWGGHGPAMVFLAGFGNTAHVFDGLAPEFTATHHVVAITRRGFGASSRPATGYDTGTLATDIVAVLDSLRVRRATFVGHSFAGSELHYLGARHAARVAQLIYLEASYDFPRLYSDSSWQHAFPIPRPPLTTGASSEARRRWFTLVFGPALPDHEMAVLTVSGTSADLGERLQRGAGSLPLSEIRVPVLALWAAPKSVDDQYPYASSLTSPERARLAASFAAQQAVRRTHFDQFRASLPNAQMRLLVRARHYVFLSHRQQVITAMRSFLASPRAQPNER